MSDEVFQTDLTATNNDTSSKDIKILAIETSADVKRPITSSTTDKQVEDLDNDTKNKKSENNDGQQQLDSRKVSGALSDDDDTKLKQNDNGTLISRGGEFGADESETISHNNDTSLTSLQDHSDIRFFICGTCKNNPILIGSVPKLLPGLHSFCEN